RMLRSRSPSHNGRSCSRSRRSPWAGLPKDRMGCSCDCCGTSRECAPRPRKSRARRCRARPPSVQVGKQRGDVRDDDDGAERHQRLVAPLAGTQGAEQRAGDEGELEGQIERRRQRAIENRFLADADHQQQDQQAEEPAVVFVVVGAQVDRSLDADVRQYQAGQQVQRNGLRQHDGEAKEAPIMPEAQVVHRPPHLHVEHQQQDGPGDAWPVVANARAGQHQAAKTLQHLGDRQAQDDRQQHGEVTESVHRSISLVAVRIRGDPADCRSRRRPWQGDSAETPRRMFHLPIRRIIRIRGGMRPGGWITATPSSACRHRVRWRSVRRRQSSGKLLPHRRALAYGRRGMGKGRLEAFSDGVIAIIITIMVLELKVPAGHTLGDLLPLAPVLLGYVLSFAYVGIYWNNHHHMLFPCHRVSGAALWANLHLLFWLSLFPFTTAWMGESYLAVPPTVAYGVVLLMAAIAYWILQRTLIAADGAGSMLRQAIGSD